MDFLITDSGDLMFSEPTKHDKLKISFRRSNSKNLRINFRTLKEAHFEPGNKNRLKVSFLTSEDEPRYSSEAQDKATADRQKLLIALRTERGEIFDRDWLGSNLQNIKHLQINRESFLGMIEQDIAESIKHIIPNAKVAATRMRSDGYTGVNNVSVSIFSNEIVLFKFYI